jgi:hypothetical protein
MVVPMSPLIAVATAAAAVAIAVALTVPETPSVPGHQPGLV